MKIEALVIPDQGQTKPVTRVWRNYENNEEEIPFSSKEYVSIKNLRQFFLHPLSILQLYISRDLLSLYANKLLDIHQYFKIAQLYILCGVNSHVICNWCNFSILGFAQSGITSKSIWKLSFCDVEHLVKNMCRMLL